MNKQASSYIPGVCNINQAEAAYRKKTGLVGLALFAVFLAVVVLLDLPSYLRLLGFAPAFIAVIGYLQARHTFCVAYGAAGKQNATEGSQLAAPIIDKGAQAKDKAKARRLNQRAAIIAALVTAASLLIPS